MVSVVGAERGYLGCLKGFGVQGGLVCRSVFWRETKFGKEF